MISYLLNLNRSTKRTLFLLVDTFFISIALYIAFALRYGKIVPTQDIGSSWVLFPIMSVVGAAVIHFLGLPRIKLNAFENRAMVQVGVTAASLTVIAIVCSYMLSLAAPRSVPVTFGVLFFMMSVVGKVTGLYVISYFSNKSGDRATVIIYGAGSAGIQLAAALRQSQEARPVAFVDDNPTLSGLMIAGLQVHSPANLINLIARYRVKRILLALPSVDKKRREKIIESLAELPVEILVMPSFIDMMSGNSGLDSLRPVRPDELLGRGKVDLQAPEISETYDGRVVMVTGAGGSIGSELCRQLLDCKPAKIILFEQSEFQLYSIDQELQAAAFKNDLTVFSRLGSVTDSERVSSIIAEFGVEIILHAAAYKHVPIVEENELEGVRNNVLGTHVLAEAANRASIERMILVSTDKAVRPTNVMGATKRMAELVLQDIQTRSEKTKFAMVRFGNVLGSSGSVLPLFQRQIATGGPVTVTHPEVTRFFMTIPEAARLVLLAGAFSKGGDVFVLDMGRPQKILDIAKQMIELSGYTTRDPDTGVGDIEIQFTGLRPGEKLYEELLIDDESLLGTPHAKILRAEESFLSQMEIASMLSDLRAALKEGDSTRVRELIVKRVEGYQIK